MASGWSSEPRDSGATRFVVADAHPIFRVGLVQTLNGSAGLRLVGETADGREAVELCRRLRPDLVLMDVRMFGMDGLAATRAIREEYPPTKVLVVTAVEDPKYLSEALRAGAAGYVLKNASQQEVVDAVQSVLRGERPLNQGLATRLLLHLMDRVPKEELAALVEAGLPGKPKEAALTEMTPREADVLRLIARGWGNQEIAKSLHVSLSTVKKYVGRVFDKLGVSDRTQAAVKAHELGLVSEHESQR